MKQKLVKYSDAGIQMMTNKDAVVCEFTDYINWIKGRPIVNHFTKTKLKQYLSSDISIKDGLLYPVVGSKIFFSLSFKEDYDNWLFVDLDFKHLKDITDEEKEEFKQDIIDVIQLDEEMSSKVRSVVKSGKDVNNGLHILIYSREKLENKTQTYNNFITQLSILLDFKWRKHFINADFLDSSSRDINRFFKSIWGIGFEHLNEDSIWEDFVINFNSKLYVPDTYQPGFHNKLRSWIYSTSLTEREIFEMYKDDLDKRPFNEKTANNFGQELNRLKKYIGSSKKTIQNLIQSEFFYINDKGQEKINEDNVAKRLFDDYDFVKDNSDMIYMKRKSSNLWIPYYRDRNLQRWDFIPDILEDFDINSIQKEKLLSKTITDIIQLRNLKGDLPKRDLDTRDSVVFNIKTLSGEIKQLKVTKDKVEFIKKDIIKGSEVSIPINDIDLTEDWQQWPLYKIGFFKNIVDDEQKYFKIIGFMNHMNSSTINGLRFIIQSDSIDEIQGGGGKTLSALAATRLRNVVPVKYDNKASSDKFFLQNCNTTTHILQIDEFPKDGNIEFFRDFYNPTQKYVEKKFKEPIKIDPIKLIINTNYNLTDHNPDKERRVEISFKRYYNRETNPVSKDLGNVLAFTDSRLQTTEPFVNSLGETIYPEKWWNGYINFIIHCVQLYLNDINTRFEDMVDVKASLMKKHERYLENSSMSKLYMDIIHNVDNITTTNEEEYSIRNTQLCDTHSVKTRTLAIIEHMLKTYLAIDGRYEYNKKQTDNAGVKHIITKIKK